MRFLPAVLGLLLLALPALHADDAWFTDFAKAQAAAKAQNRPILIDFTGADWCPGCIFLHKTVLTTPEFEKYAAANLVLMTVDVPDGGFPDHLTTPLEKQNAPLLDVYKVEGFPTLILVKPDGTTIRRLDDAMESLSQSLTGKVTGHPGVLIKQIDAALAKKK